MVAVISCTPRWLLTVPAPFWTVAAVSRWWVAYEWLLLFPGGFWVVAIISWWLLDASCHSLVACGWLPLFPKGFWTVAVHSQWHLIGCRWRPRSGLLLFS